MIRKLRILAFMYTTRRHGESLGGAERRILQLSEFAQNIETHFLEKKPAIAKFYTKQPSHTAWTLNPNARIPAQLRAIIWSITALLSTIKLSSRFRFDVLVSHDPEFWNVLPLLLASKLTGRPSAAYLHHTERMSSNAPAKGFTEFYLYFKGLGYHRASALFSAAEKVLSVALLKRLDLLFAVSQTTRKDFAARGVSESKMVVVANGIDVTHLAAFRNTDKRFDIAYLGRIAPRKGIDDLTYIMEKIPDAKAIVIGGGAPRDVDHYRRVMGMPNIEFTGYLPDNDACSLLASSRLFVFPSYEEGFGLVIGEAMALGVPVICYDVPALVEVWGDAVSFVKTGDREALAKKVSSMLKDDERLKTLSEKGLNYITRYDWLNIVDGEARVLRSLAAGRRR